MIYRPGARAPERIAWLVHDNAADKEAAVRLGEIDPGLRVQWIASSELDDLTCVRSLDLLVLVGSARWHARARAMQLRARARGVPCREWQLAGLDDLSEDDRALAWDELRDWCRGQLQSTLDGSRQQRTDPVAIAVAARTRVAPKTVFVLRFAAYPDTVTERAAVEATLLGMSPTASAQLDVRKCRWTRGSKVRVCVQGHGVRCAHPSQDITWQGHRELLDFPLRVSSEARPGEQLAVSVSIFIEGVSVARVALELLVEGRSAQEEPKLHMQCVATKAFASYARANRTLVYHRVASLRNAAGMDVFVDCLDLMPGDTFKSRLEEEIGARDLFLLFWSEEAAKSPWVEWEWRTALRRRGISAIRPQPLSGHHVPLPSELSGMHGTDFLIELVGQPSAVE